MVQREPHDGSSDLPQSVGFDAALELTILMPCLNEAETLATCIAWAQQFLVSAGVAGEVLIADKDRKSTRLNSSHRL